MDIFITILSMVAFAIVILGVYYLLKAYVLRKVSVSRWVVLAVGIVLFLVPTILWPGMPKYVSNYVIPGMAAILFLWFMDLSGFMKKREVAKTNTVSTSTKKDKKNDVVIRPKAKPNRVKNNKK